MITNHMVFITEKVIKNKHIKKEQNKFNFIPIQLQK